MAVAGKEPPAFSSGSLAGRSSTLPGGSISCLLWPPRRDVATAFLMLPPLLRKPDIWEHRPDLVQGILHQEGELIVPVIVGNGAGDMDFLL